MHDECFQTIDKHCTLYSDVIALKKVEWACWNYSLLGDFLLVRKFSSKSTKLGPKIPSLGKFCSKIKILSTYNFVGNLQLSVQTSKALLTQTGTRNSGAPSYASDTQISSVRLMASSTEGPGKQNHSTDGARRPTAK